jgi:hypothetical protein
MALQVRRSIHRGTPGYLICGRRPGGSFPILIFVRRRETAERMRAKLNAGGRIELQDFAGDNPQASEEKMNDTKEHPWPGPRSFCECGHTGDGPNSQHADSVHGARGHGKCLYRDCPCGKFTWDRFIRPYAKRGGK